MNALPIAAKEDLIVSKLLEHQVIIVEGETGSGKTTQIPIFLYEAGFSQQGMIGVTQPRRFAATSVAKYVAQLSGKPMGDIVGYHVRFDKASDRFTAIKFMTVGILLGELQSNPDLSGYSVIMIDEAHERTEEMDLLLGFLKRILLKRKQLRLIVASATADTTKFSAYFNRAPVIKVSGRTFPVDVNYLPKDFRNLDQALDAMIAKIMEIHVGGVWGNILAFVPGKAEVHRVIDGILAHGRTDLMPLPLYAGMEYEEQERALSPQKMRKVIVCTNIAETSITVDDVGFVIDSGYIKESDYSSENSMAGLDTIEHSQAGCEQRKGRAGRTRPGVCYRLYSENSFRSRPAFTVPEIRRSEFTSSVVKMSRLGVPDPAAFDFIEAPDPVIVKNAQESLAILGALDARTKMLTKLGLQMSSLPVEPVVSKMLLQARSFDCLSEMITIAAFMAANGGFFLRPKGLEGAADKKHNVFYDGQSDMLVFLNIWNGYQSAGCDKGWCQKHFLNHRALWEIGSIRDQLEKKFVSVGAKITSTNNLSVLLRCVTAALRYNVFEYRPGHGYCALFQNVEGVQLHPSSALKAVKARFIIPTKVVETTGRYARNCTIARPEWLAEFLPQMFVAKEFANVRGKDTFLADQSIYYRGQKVGTKIIFLTAEELAKAKAA